MRELLNAFLIIRMTKEQKEKIEKQAKEMGITISKYIRIKLHLDE